jgi:DNA-binding transcriptional ArsR family regulator
MDAGTIASTLSALAHPSRVEVFKLLLGRYPAGMTSGDLAQAMDMAPSTLSHHLREMEAGGVIGRRAEGQRTITTLNLPYLTSIISQFMQLCCSVETAPKEGDPS